MESFRLPARAALATLLAVCATGMAIASEAGAASTEFQSPISAWSASWQSLSPAAVTVPGAPRSAAATASSGSITVTWLAPTSTGGSSITSYKATASPGGAFCTTTSRSCVIRGLSNGTAYTATVRATNRIGSSAASNRTSPVTPTGPPLAPNGVTGIAGEGFVDVSWIAPSSNGGAEIDSYVVTSSPGAFTCSTTGATSCRVEGLTNGTAYTFTVEAHNSLGTGSRSAASSAIVPGGKPAKPTAPTAKSIDHGLMISWTAPVDGGSPILGYTVTAQPGGATCTTTALTCTINSLENGTPYTLTLVARNAAGDSQDSDASSPYTPFAKPSQVAQPVAEPRPSAAVVSWNAPTDNGSPITKYTVTSSPSSKTCIATTLTSCVVTGLSNGTAYTFTVKATNAAGDSTTSVASNRVTPRLAPGGPGTPTVVVGNAKATVTWTPPKAITGSSPITGYRVTSKPEGLTCETTTELSCEVNGLTNGTSYTFSVQALSGVGPGIASRSTPSVIPSAPPEAPTAVTAVAGLKRATVTWTPPENTGGAPIASYTVTSNPGGYVRNVKLTSATFTGLEVGTSYTFTVVASNPGGTSAESDPSEPVEIVPIEDPPFGNGFWLGVDEPNAADVGGPTSDWANLLKQPQPRVFREQFIWYRIAPTKPANATNPADPAYVWTKMDKFARLTKEVGAEGLINFYGAPTWAEGASRISSAAAGSWKPNPEALRDFGTAMATRYSGSYPDPLNAGSTLPRIRMFEAWNEPNYKYFLQPQYETVKGKRTLTLPDRYRELLNSFYDGVKAVQPDSIVMTSGLGPYGRSSAGVEIQPQSFIRGVLCVSGNSLALKDEACPVKPKLDGVAIHPYTLQGKPTDKAKDPNGGGLGNTPDFARELAAAVKYDNVEPAGPKKLYATEFVWLTNPPGRVSLSGPKIGIAPTLAAQYTSETIYRLYRWGASGAVWYGLRDRVNFWPGGLFFAGSSVATSTAKPGLKAFVTPFFVSATSTGVRYWSKTTCMGPNALVTFEGKVGKTWTMMRSATPAEDGIAQETAARPRGVTTFRAIATDANGCSTTSVEMPVGTG